MNANYDFTGARRNPYAKRLKKQLTIRLDPETLQYFQDLAAELSLPYQTLITWYLRQCAVTQLRPTWVAKPKASRKAPAARGEARKRAAG